MAENKVDTGYWVDWMITHQMGKHKIGKTKWAKASIELLLVDCGAPISAIMHPVVIFLLLSEGIIYTFLPLGPLYIFSPPLN